MITSLFQGHNTIIRSVYKEWLLITVYCTTLLKSHGFKMYVKGRRKFIVGQRCIKNPEKKIYGEAFLWKYLIAESN